MAHQAKKNQQKERQSNHEAPGSPPFEGMVWIPGGIFQMGSNAHYREEAPVHEVTVDGFWMDRFTVTNDQFRQFVEATGRVTSAERPPKAEDYPGAIPELLVPASVVFTVWSEYSVRASQYVEQFRRKWLSDGSSSDQELLGSADIQSLADLTGSFEVGREMRLFPIGTKGILLLTLILVLPYMPLFLTMMPLKEIVNRVVKILV